MSNMYIRSAACLSPAFPLETAVSALPDAGGWRVTADQHQERRRYVIEPDYSQYVDAKMIRRMSRIVKMGVAPAVRCLQAAGMPVPGAIITGTAYGCLEDSSLFLRKMISNKEELLSPTAFIQSTHNTVGAQVALLLKCHSYNNTIVHRAFSLEHSLTEARMLLAEGTRPVLVGAIDEVTRDSFALLSRFGLYRTGRHSAGEGAAFFLLQPEASGADLARIGLVATRHDAGAGKTEIMQWIRDNLSLQHLEPAAIGTVLDGSDGMLEQEMAVAFPAANYLDFKKHCGEYPTASGFGLWLAAVFCSKPSTPGKPVLLFNRSVDGHLSLILVHPC